MLRQSIPDIDYSIAVEMLSNIESDIWFITISKCNHTGVLVTTRACSPRRLQRVVSYQKLQAPRLVSFPMHVSCMNDGSAQPIDRAVRSMDLSLAQLSVDRATID